MSAGEPSKPWQVFVTVGSDHHRFDRLVGWVDSWAASRTDGTTVLIQHGPATPPTVATGVDFLPHDELLAHMAAADVVVCQGGPMSILEARQQGKRPIVLPRTAALDEVVDNHQHAFSRRIVADGWIELVEDEAGLHAAMDAAAADPELSRVEPDPIYGGHINANRARFARTADGVLASAVGHRPLGLRVVDGVAVLRARLTGGGASRSGGAPAGRHRDQPVAATAGWGQAAPPRQALTGHRSGPGVTRSGDPRVLLLGGLGRSGSTLLERALGEVPGVAALGEVLHLWERGLRDDERCGCGEAFSACPFWEDVGKRAYSGWSDIGLDEAVEDRQAVVRNRNISGLVLGMPSATMRLRRSRLQRRLSALYVAARDVAEAELLVDSSKHPAYAFTLRGSRVRLRCALVVRDPRGVAFSWAKTVNRPEVTGRQEDMPRYAAGASALRWSVYGVLFAALRVVGVPVLTVRYEDLVADPRGTVERVLAFAGLDVPPAGLSHLHPDSIELGPHHTVAGNPMRFVVGPTPVRLDEAWRTEMPTTQRRLVSALTAPLRGRYGYR